MTGILFCLYIKLFQASISNFVDFWNSIFGVVVVFELEDKNVAGEFGFSINGNGRGHSFLPSKKIKPTKHAFLWTKNMQEFVWSNRCLDYSDLPNILSRDVEGEYFLRWVENWKIPGCLLDKDVENTDHLGCPNVQDLVDPKRCRNVDLITLPVQTQVHSSFCQAQSQLVWYLDNAAFDGVSFVLFFNCIVSIYVIKSYKLIPCFVPDSWQK